MVFSNLTSLSPPSLASKLLSTLTAILTLGLYKPSRPKTRLMPFTRWRARRQSVKELRKEEAAVHEEYLKLRELDNRVMKAKPPSYGVVVGLGGEEVVSLGMGTRTSSSSTSGGSAVGTGRTTSENGLQMSGGGSAR
ncbi:hypothetical protein BKA61DRAFT_665191 [Leptodontidium sp. MPI-SDFR-AT-0119]|nr:hypothetical protein BKA61DRAFT_665191 [Leptodontidium sp. MPI-SDFR-AT-0119]